MIKATPPPAARNKTFIAIPYIYAAVLAALAIEQLMGMGGFDFAGIKYQTPGLPAVIVIIAALEIFSIPFLIRLNLSGLARVLSSIFAAITPLFILANMLYLTSQNERPFSWLTLSGAIILVLAGFGSYYVLNGQAALTAGKK